MKMEKDKWVWMGHAGHFILGDKCRFHLNTYVGKYVVSTVGELWNERGVREIHAKVHDSVWLSRNVLLKGDTFDNAYFKRFGYEEIGCDRKYETMVFRAKKSDHKCCPYEIVVSKEVDFEGYNDAKNAYAGHLKMCKKWSKR
jgi:hypothetical protein